MISWPFTILLAVVVLLAVTEVIARLYMLKVRYDKRVRQKVVGEGEGVPADSGSVHVGPFYGRRSLVVDITDGGELSPTCFDIAGVSIGWWRASKRSRRPLSRREQRNWRRTGRRRRYANHR